MIVGTHEYNTNSPMQVRSVLSVQSPWASVLGPIPKFDEMIPHDVAKRERTDANHLVCRCVKFSTNKQKEHTGFCYCIQWY